MPVRKLFLLFSILCCSLTAQAQELSPQDQAAAQQYMAEKMEKALLSGLTQKDVDSFLKFVEASKNLKSSDKKA